MNLPPLEALEREIGLRGTFFQFVRMAWEQLEKSPLAGAWYIKAICDRLEAVTKGEPAHLVINIPPGMGKSTITCVLWPIWIWLREPRTSIMSLSVSHDVTVRDSARGLALIQSPWFQARWGDRLSVRTDAGVAKYDTLQGGHREAGTFGGQVLGKHPDVVIIDDPIKPQALSPTTIESAKRFWRDTLASRQANPKTIRRVCIMQRLHVEDLAGVFAQQGWPVLRLPMRFEPEAADAFDVRKDPGELLAPDRIGETEVVALEKIMGSRTAAAQLQQRPFPEGGAIIKRAWLRWYDPKNAPRFTRKMQTWDLTFKGTETSHHVAGQVWGVFGPDYYFVDGILDRLDIVDTCRAILAMSSRHPDAIGVLIEEKANGPAVMRLLRDKISGIIGVEPEGGKDARLNAAAPVVEAGNVHLPIGHPIAEALADHLEQFPAGDIDDDVDAFTQIINHLHGRVLDYAAAMKNLRGGMF